MKCVSPNQASGDADPPIVVKQTPPQFLTHGRATEHDDFAGQHAGVGRQMILGHPTQPASVEQDGALGQPIERGVLTHVNIGINPSFGPRCAVDFFRGLGGEKHLCTLFQLYRNRVLVAPNHAA